MTLRFDVVNSQLAPNVVNGLDGLTAQAGDCQGTAFGDLGPAGRPRPGCRRWRPGHPLHPGAIQAVPGKHRSRPGRGRARSTRHMPGLRSPTWTQQRGLPGACTGQDEVVRRCFHAVTVGEPDAKYSLDAVMLDSHDAGNAVLVVDQADRRGSPSTTWPIGHGPNGGHHRSVVGKTGVGGWLLVSGRRAAAPHRSLGSTR